MSFAIIAKLDAQTLEHFNVKESKHSWILTPKFDDIARSGFHGRFTGNVEGSVKWIRSNLSKLPETIKKEIFQEKNEIK